MTTIITLTMVLHYMKHCIAGSVEHIRIGKKLGDKGIVGHVIIHETTKKKVRLGKDENSSR